MQLIKLGAHPDNGGGGLLRPPESHRNAVADPGGRLDSFVAAAARTTAGLGRPASSANGPPVTFGSELWPCVVS